MESIREGWLIKSPPEIRPQGRWKLFKAKWRRRYFVLYAPPAMDIIPGMRAAILDYYSGKNLRQKNGTIDLAHCEEVLSQLDATFYQNIFGLRTKHKNRDRTYYLVAESEADMNEWVNSLCFVLGMKENVQESCLNLSLPSLPPLQQPTMKLSMTSSALRFNSVPCLPPPRCDTLPAHRERRLPSSPRVQSLPVGHEAVDWQMRVDMTSTTPNVATLLHSRDSSSSLKFAPLPPPPPPLNSSQQQRIYKLRTVVDQPPPSLPRSSMRDGTIQQSSVHNEYTDRGANACIEYDHPKKSYASDEWSDKSNNNFYCYPKSYVPTDTFYNVPKQHGMKPDCLYKTPPARLIDYAIPDDISYDVPLSARCNSYDIPTRCSDLPSPHDAYDVPPSSVESPNIARIRSTENNEVRDIIGSSHLLSVLQNLLDELPTLEYVPENNVLKTPVYCNLNKACSLLDSQISSRELLSLSPPVPSPSDMKQHFYINGTSSGRKTLENGMNQSLSTVNINGSPVASCQQIGSIHPAYSPILTARDPICFTHRSKSFRRTVTSSKKDEIQLPRKRIVNVEETSDSDDEEERSNSSHDCSNNEVVIVPKPTIYDVVPLPTKTELHSLPDPKNPDSIKYLDLDLCEVASSDTAAKTFEPSNNVSETNYKEIDWCRTKALMETRKEVENKRKSSERN